MTRNTPRVKTLSPALPSQCRMAQRGKLRKKDTLKTLILRLAQCAVAGFLSSDLSCMCVHALACVYMCVAFSFAIVKEFFFVFVLFAFVFDVFIFLNYIRFP